MGEMTLAEYEEAVIDGCGNVSLAHPVLAHGRHTQAINKAPNFLIRSLPDFFPEHKDNTWTVGPTVVGSNRVELPENLLVLRRVVSSEDATPTGSDWTLVREQPLALVDMHVIGMIDKPATVTGYPTMCARKSNDLLYNATTRTGFTTYFRFYGDAGEVPLVGAGETFRMHRDFDGLIVQIATADTLKYMRQYAAAAEIMTDVVAQLRQLRGVVATERAARPMRYVPAGAPPGLFGGGWGR